MAMVSSYAERMKALPMVRAVLGQTTEEERIRARRLLYPAMLGQEIPAPVKEVAAKEAVKKAPEILKAVPGILTAVAPALPFVALAAGVAVAFSLVRKGLKASKKAKKKRKARTAAQSALVDLGTTVGALDKAIEDLVTISRSEPIDPAAVREADVAFVNARNEVATAANQFRSLASAGEIAGVEIADIAELGRRKPKKKRAARVSWLDAQLADFEEKFESINSNIDALCSAMRLSRVTEEEALAEYEEGEEAMTGTGLGQEEKTSAGLTAALPSLQKGIVGAATGESAKKARGDRTAAQQLLVDLQTIADGLASGTGELIGLLQQGYMVDRIQVTEADIALVNARSAAKEGAKMFAALAGTDLGFDLGRTAAQKKADRIAWLNAHMANMDKLFRQSDTNLTQVAAVTGIPRVSAGEAAAAYGLGPPVAPPAVPVVPVAIPRIPVAPPVVPVAIPRVPVAPPAIPTIAYIAGGGALVVLLGVLAVVMLKKKS